MDTHGKYLPEIRWYVMATAEYSQAKEGSKGRIEWLDDFVCDGENEDYNTVLL